MIGIEVIRRPGLTFLEAVRVAEKRVPDGPCLIMRHGGYFRPKAHGYTCDVTEAGIYSAEEARSYLSVEGILVIPLSRMIGKAEQAVVKATANLERMKAALLEMRLAALPPQQRHEENANA